MGQYFQPCLLAEDRKKVLNWMYSHHYDNGLKLMEHSYLGNDFVSAFETLIANKPQRVVWAGDYADAETKTKRTRVILPNEIIDFTKENISRISSDFVDKKLTINIDYNKDLVLYNEDIRNVAEMERVLIEKINSFVSSVKEYETFSFNIIPGVNIKDNSITVPLVFELKNMYGKCEDKMQINPATKDMSEFRYIVNHEKKQFVDKTKVPNIKDEKDFKIHPLPLLTCESNGRGGGDFRGDDKRIGTWARDLISVEQEKPAGFEELIFDLVER